MSGTDAPRDERPLALITGASSGIGRSVAVELGRRRYRMILIARRADRLRQLVAELDATDAIVAAPLDLNEPDRISETVGPLLEAHGPVEVLLNCAGNGLCVPFLQHDERQHRRLMQVLYFAPLALIRAVLPGMLARERGHVINIASIATKIGPWGHSGYAAAKNALVALTQSLACEHGDHGVHFSYVNPGIVRTEFFDDPSYSHLQKTVQRRAISPQRVARRIVALLDRPRIEMCIPAHYRVLDWFKAVSPTWAQRMVARSSRPGRE